MRKGIFFHMERNAIFLPGRKPPGFVWPRAGHRAGGGMKGRPDPAWGYFLRDWPARIKSNAHVAWLAFDSAQHLLLENLTGRLINF